LADGWHSNAGRRCGHCKCVGVSVHLKVISDIWVA
jgi:hypothetical protein